MMVLAALSATAGGTPTATCAADIARAVRQMETNVSYDVTATVAFLSQRAVAGIQDETGSAAITDFHHNRFDSIRVGDRIHASGYTKTSTNSLIPTAYCERISVLSHGTPPKPTDVTATEFHSGKFDYAYVRVKGVVRDVFTDEIDGEWFYLVIGSEHGSVFASFFKKENQELDLSRLEGAEVAISGLCSKLRVDRRPGSRHALRRILSASAKGTVEVLKPSPEDPFAVPELELAKESSPEEIALAGRRRIAGRVVAVWEGGRYAILKPKNRGDVVQCELKNGAIPKCGDFIEAVGIPETDLYRINLARAIWRKSDAPSARQDDKPQDISADDLFVDENGKPDIQTKFHGRPVRIRGIVRSLPAEGSPEKRLYLECGNHTLPIDIGSAAESLQDVAIGSEVSVTGVCVTKVDSWSQHAPFPHIREVFLVTRSPSDILVIRRPPWWTPGRLFVLLAAMLAGMLTIFAWNVSLRRLAEQRGRHLAEEHIARAETDMKVMERTRLAVELHDSVAQNLTAVAMELETARQFQDGAPREMLDHLGIAWRTLKSCREELRNCLWDLRSQALEEQDVETAVHRTLLPHVKGIDISVRFKVPRTLISDNTTHAILRIIRELVLNGIRHGGAKTIRVEGGVEGGALSFSVQDDGRGFDPEKCPGVAEGHFGLQGIRERVRQLSGTLAIESGPGRGAKAIVTIPIPKGDKDDQGSAD